jgi:[protein-PII] uridylyltransferase
MKPPPGSGANRSQQLGAMRDELAAAVVAGELSPEGFSTELCSRLDSYLNDSLARACDGDERGLCLAAVGSYGRKELSPGSDLDLLLLHSRRRPASETAERLWYELWDAGLSIDHAVRTPEEAVSLANDDLKVLLGLLKVRPIAGEIALATATGESARSLFLSHRDRQTARLAAEGADRHGLFGELAFLLEPDLKDSAGGLRDLEAISSLLVGFPELREVAPESFLAPRRALLHGVRVHLQARTKNRSNRLVLQEQQDVAKALGDENADALAGRLAFLGREVSRRYEKMFWKANAILEGPSRRSSSRPRELADEVLLEDGEILWPGRTSMARPAVLFRLARAAALSNAPIREASLNRLVESLEIGTRNWDEEDREAFLSFLSCGRQMIAPFEALDEAGAFERLLPEWERVRHRPQRNAYHRFTVDRHLLETVAEAGALLRQVSRPDLLLVSALLHDIGKGTPGDHSEEGRKLAGTVMSRMNFPRRDVLLVERLVKRHLLLADTATRRDIEATETLELVADALGDTEGLELLAALTKADSLATGPAAWSEWKSSLLDALVENVRAYMTKSQQPKPPGGTPDSDILVRAATGELSVTWNRWSLSIVAPDRPGLFAVVSGVLALNGLVVRRASLQTLEGASITGVAMAVQSFDLAARDDRPAAQLLEADIVEGLAGRLSLETRLAGLDESYARYRRPVMAGRTEVEVLVDPAATEKTVFVEVRAADSKGLLHRLASAIEAAGLDVVSAHIATLGGEVVDGFYLRDRATGTKPATDQLLQVQLFVKQAASRGFGHDPSG